MFRAVREESGIAYCACTINQPKFCQLHCLCMRGVFIENLHLQSSRRTKVGLENILKTFTGTDVHLQGLSSPLREMLVCGHIIEGPSGNIFHTLDSALGLSS